MDWEFGPSGPRLCIQNEEGGLPFDAGYTPGWGTNAPQATAEPGSPSTESMRSRAHALQEDRAAAGEAHTLQRRLGSARKKRMDEQLDPTVYCRKLDSISWDKPRWKRTLKRMDICVKRVTFL